MVRYAIRRGSVLAVALVAILMPLPANASAGGSGWSIEHTPNPEAAKDGALLYSVACVPGTCIGVGNYTNSSSHSFPLAEARDHGTWTTMTTPIPDGATDGELNGVACVDASMCVAVGDYRVPSGVDSTMVETWNGSVWTIQPSPNPQGATHSSLNDVACLSPTSCVAVGTAVLGTAIGYTSGLAETWDGARWQLSRPIEPKGATGTYLNGVICIGATSCVGVGDYDRRRGALRTLAERWDGSAWTIQQTPNPPEHRNNSLYGVSCTSASACISVGGYKGALAERWDGSVWTIQPTPDPAGAAGLIVLGDVSCSNATWCTAVGFYGTASGGQKSLAEVWDGSVWSIQPTPRPRKSSVYGLQGLWCQRRGACTAVGFKGLHTLSERE